MRRRAEARSAGLALALAVIAPVMVAPPEARAAPPSAAAPAPLGRELPSLRTRASRTYVGQGGRRVSRFFSGSVNYKDASGDWQKIDNGLQATGDGFSNKANGYRVKLPKELTKPVRVSKDGAWVEYRLKGAAGMGSLDGSSAHYRGALDGVDVTYAASSDAVKESLTLAGPQSKNTFRFALRTSPGLSAKVSKDGSIDIVDAAGERKFSFVPPVMWDSSKRKAVSRKVAVELTRGGDGYSLELRPSRAWLEDARRRWPVVVDPTVTLRGAALDCSIPSSSCVSDHLPVDWVIAHEASRFESRSLLKFDLSSVPKDAAVLSARMGLYADSWDLAPRTVEALPLTKPWTSSVSWDFYDGTNRWAQPGGDFSAESGSVTQGLGGAPGWADWQLTGAVQKWVDQSSPNYGVILRDPSEYGEGGVYFRSSDHPDPASRPYLEVRWQPPTGDYPQATFSKHRLTDRSRLGVNVSNGNLLVDNDDLAIAGTGLDLKIGRAYNSLSESAESLGPRWSMGTGQDVRIRVNEDQSVTFYDQTGAALAFQRKSDGSFESPLGLHATLKQLSPTTYDLTYNQTGEKLSFTSSGPESWGRLTAQKDRYNNTISFAYNAGKLASITDTQGRVITAQQDPSGKIAKLTDPTGRTVQYAYDAQGRLEVHTDTSGNQSRYGYDSAGRLGSITTPAGRVTRMTYDSQGRVATVVRTTDAAHTSGPTTDFAYGSGSPCSTGETKTVVSDPLAASAAGHTVTYCSDSRDRVTKAVDSSNNATSLTYGATGDRASVSSPGGGVTNYSYDSATRNLVCVQRGATAVGDCGGAADGLKTTFAYANSDGLTKYFPTRITNPQGHGVALCYNGSTPACGSSSGPAGSVQSVTNELSSQSVSRFSYNAKGKLTSATDARGYATGYGYDAQGNLTGVTPPAGAGLGSWAISPDALSRPGTVTDGKGQTSTYSYDRLDRPTGLAYPGGPTFGFGYDADGNRTSLSDPSGTSTYAFDQLGRVSREDFPGGASNSYSFDAAGNLTALADAGGTTTYAYDGLNQLASVTEPGAPAATGFAYNADGARTQIRYPSGVSVNTAYDLPSGRILSVANEGPSGGVLKSFAYSYRDPGGRDTELAQSVTDEAGNRTVNTYDALERLVGAVTTGPSPSRFGYTIDGDGHRTSNTINRAGFTGGETEVYAYDSAGLPCWRGSGALPADCSSPPQGIPYAHYSHDANGSDLDNSHQRYSYNTAGQPTSTFVYAIGTTATLGYRGPGQTQLIGDGSYTLQNNLLGIGQRTGPPPAAAAAPQARAAAKPCNEQTSAAFAATSAETTRYARAPDGTLLSRRPTDTTAQRNYLYDAEGSIVGLTDPAGTLKTSYRYEPYGHPANFTSLGDPNPFGYQGAYTAGVEDKGVICGGPNQTGGAFYDAEDGRNTQMASVAFGSLGIDLPDLPPLSLDLNGSFEVGPLGGEVGVELDQDFHLRPYVGGGGGFGGGVSLSLSAGHSRSGPNTQACWVACLGIGEGSASFGAGPKGSVGIFDREFLSR